MIGEDQRVCHNDIFPPAGCENHNLSDIVWCERLNTLVNSFGFGFVATEADN